MKKTLFLTLALFTFTIVVSSYSSAAVGSSIIFRSCADDNANPGPSTVKSAIDEFRKSFKKRKKNPHQKRKEGDQEV
jgi:hypothetical protein